LDTVLCPSCGGELAADSRYARLVVCGYCDSAIVLDEKTARVAGKMAVLAQTPTPLFVGGTGRVLDRAFSVLGRVRYGYAKGYWDEWYLLFDDGETGWISEDERNITLERLEPPGAWKGEFATVSPGDNLSVAGSMFHVDEKNIAECEGGEGQLPFAIVSGEKVPFLDLSNDEAFATVEFDTEGETRVFRGTRVDFDDLVMDQSAEEAGSNPQGVLRAERIGDDDRERRERIIRQAGRSLSIKCFHCGAPLQVASEAVESITCQYCSGELDLTLRRVDCANCGATVPVRGGREAHSVVCSHCHTQLDVRREEPHILASLVGLERPVTPFHIGQKCRFRGQDYEVSGHIRFVELEEGIRYISDEFLLFSKEVGYRWLIWENNHFSWCEELEKRPMGVRPERLVAGESFRFMRQDWRVFEVSRSLSAVEFVDGELPWVARIGDRSSYMDAACPPQLLSAEWTDEEQEWYIAEYVQREEVAEAFARDVNSFPPAIGVAPHQPFRRSRFRKEAAQLMLLASVFFFVMFGWALARRCPLVADFSVAPQAYADEYLTRAFTTTKADQLYEAEFSAPCDNSWIYLDVAVVNDREEAVLDFSSQISYYHGVEGGESWSEGSRADKAVFKLAEPGEYRLLMLGQAGRGEGAGDTIASGFPVAVKIREGVELARYYLILGCVCFAWAAFEWLAKKSFEAQRLANGDDDDDDDD
jgi:DNA-directed RNA polymerase subunit RPC12/RpoP